MLIKPKAELIHIYKQIPSTVLENNRGKNPWVHQMWEIEKRKAICGRDIKLYIGENIKPKKKKNPIFLYWALDQPSNFLAFFLVFKRKKKIKGFWGLNKTL